jgi:Flp pilus assembly protein TadD
LLRDHAGALAAYDKALRSNPRSAAVHVNRGSGLRQLGDRAGAIAEYKEAIRLKPDLAEAHNQLGLVLRESGDRVGAIVEHREALRLNPSLASAHSYLGIALQRSGDLPAAITELRTAVNSDPLSGPAHNNLAGALLDSGDSAGAVLEFQEAARLDPQNPATHRNLGLALQLSGRFREALAAIERGQALAAQQPGSPYPSADWVKQCRRLAELEGQFSGILAGKDRPADAADTAGLAMIAASKGLPALAARLYADAFGQRPSLMDGPRSNHRYNAACSAALAGCGKGRDEPAPGPADRARLRAQALDWLKADLAATARRLDASPAPDRAGVEAWLLHWRNDPDLAGVRDAKELAKLPEATRPEWQALWDAVDALLHRAQKPAAQLSDPPAGELPADPFGR